MVHVCMFGCVFLTKLVSNSGGLSWVGWFANTGGVAAADAEAVGFPFSEIKQRKARRLDRDLRVHPLPAVCPRDTLTNTDKEVKWNNFSCRYKQVVMCFSVDLSFNR